MRRAEVVVETDAAPTLRASLAPEAARPLPRTRVAVTAEGDCLRLLLEAKDTPALRAALNSYLRWTAGALQMVQEARG